MAAIDYPVLAAVIFAIVAVLQFVRALLGTEVKSVPHYTTVGELDRVSCCQLACLARIYGGTRMNGAAS